MFSNVASELLVVCGEGNLLAGGRNAVGRGGLVCLYMFHRCMH